jgi:hypothetical protein
MSALLFIAIVLGLVGMVVPLRRWQRARARRREVEALLQDDPLPSTSDDRPVLAEAPAMHLSTRCDGIELRPEPCEGRLRVTDAALTFDGPAEWLLPHARLVEAVFVARHDRWTSGPGAILVRVTWRQAGRTVAAVLLVRGRRLEAERLRKELHLRAGSARPFASV